MAKRNVNQLVCPNGTTESTVRTAAISSWAGFMYQGLCALCVALEKILDDRNSNGYFLNIEGYEDFAILDNSMNILSFHQCKNYKASDDKIKAEFKKMEDKRWYWNTQKGKCSAAANLYMHAPVSFVYTNNVEAYQYRDYTSTASIKDVCKKLDSLIEEYVQIHHLPGTSVRRRDRIIALMEKTVIELDTIGKTQNLSNGVMQDQSIAHSIPFTAILDLLNQTEEKYSEKERINTSAFYINFWMQDRLMNNPQMPQDRILRFLNALSSLDSSKKADFIKRLFPDIDVFEGTNVATEISNSARINFLFNILTKTKDGLNLENLHWENNGVKQSPSTIGKDLRPDEYCGKIVKNKMVPPELLRDYDWIIGDIETTVNDILKEAHLITNVEETNYYKIMGNRKVGILSIEDKNKL